MRLHVAHPWLHLVLIDCMPDICWPVLVKLMWIFDEEHVIRIKLEIAAAAIARNWRRIRLSTLPENGQHLQTSGCRRNAADHILDFKLLQRQQLPCFMG